MIEILIKENTVEVHGLPVNADGHRQLREATARKFGFWECLDDNMPGYEFFSTMPMDSDGVSVCKQRLDEYFNKQVQ